MQVASYKSFKGELHSNYIFLHFVLIGLEWDSITLFTKMNFFFFQNSHFNTTYTRYKYTAFYDQVYSNTRVSTQVNTNRHEPTLFNTSPTRVNTSPTRVNTNQHESTRVNTNQHESDTSQHESKLVQHESNTSQHESLYSLKLS